MKIMKTCIIALGACVGFAAPVHADVAAARQVSPPEPVVIDRGPHHRTWQTVRQVQEGDRTVWRTNSYQELGTGMAYESNGAYVDSKEVIEIVNGVGVANQGQYQVIFEPNINTIGAVDALTPEGNRLRSHVLGVGYTDGTGKSVLVAQPKDC